MITLTSFLIKLVQKKESKNERSKYAALSSIVGIVCNIILCIVKFTLGSLTGSVSVTADAVNNLSDSASNIVTFTGAKLSDKPHDREHPFGHGRLEYVSALIIAVSIFVVSFELAKSSVGKIIHPEKMNFSIVYIVILALTVLVKLWMAYFNHRLYKITDNVNLKAVKQDSLNDCIATAATVISLIISHILHFDRIDGIIGVFVSAFIFWSGVDILKDVISPLLGEAPSKELAERIEAIITESNLVLGVHDLVIHSYGANKMLASADAEVDAKADIFTIHKIIDKAEKRILDELNVEMCIHMDPIDKTDLQTERYRMLAEGIVKDYNDSFSFHDFSITQHGDKKDMYFDLLVGFDEEAENEKIQKELKERFSNLCPEVNLTFTVEHSYI